jgi:hypothetical protein
MFAWPECTKPNEVLVRYICFPTVKLLSIVAEEATP